MLDTELHLIIATHAPGKTLLNTLEELSKCTIPNSFAHTWIVENGSALLDEESLKKEYPNLKINYLYLNKACKSSALNLALSRLNSGLVLFADDDIFPSKAWFVAYEQAYRQFGDQYYFGGPFEVVYEKEPLPQIKTFLPRSAHGWRLPFKEPTISPQWFVGFNWAAPVQLLKLGGGFSMRFGPGTPGGSTGEETQVQFKFASMGYQSIYVPKAEVLHPVPASRCNPLFAIRRRRRMALEKSLAKSNGSILATVRKMCMDSIGFLRILWSLPKTQFSDWGFALFAILFDFIGLIQGFWFNLYIPRRSDA